MQKSCRHASKIILVYICAVLNLYSPFNLNFEIYFICIFRNVINRIAFSINDVTSPVCSQIPTIIAGFTIGCS